VGQTLDTFDWSFQPSIDRKRIEALATCAWIREHATVLMQGPRTPGPADKDRWALSRSSGGHCYWAAP